MLYRSGEVQRLFKDKSSGTIILLKREKGNAHDANAIAVYSALTPSGTKTYEWTKVGYVDKEIAREEFYGLPLDTVLECTKYGQDTFQLSGKTREYK
jgi:hypothetical protein